MTVVLLWIGVAVSFGLLLSAHTFYWKTARDIRRDTSRFEMFAVRDRLVSVVASGAMREDDPAWQMMYQTVNSVLDISYKTTVLQQLIGRARLAARIAKDPKCAARMRSISETLKAGERQTPQFSKVLRRMEAALTAMARARTPAWEWWLLVLLVLVLVPYVFVRRAAREVFFNPSAAVAATLIQWAQGSGPLPRLASQ